MRQAFGMLSLVSRRDVIVSSQPSRIFHHSTCSGRVQEQGTDAVENLVHQYTQSVLNIS